MSPLNPHRLRRLLLAPTLVATLGLAACGDDDDASTATVATAEPAASSPSPEPSGSAASAEFNDADVAFAQHMIVHHQQAIEMAAMAEDPARRASADVLDLAARVKAAQEPEIQTMTGWLAAWGQPVEPEMDMSGGMDGMSSMPGSMSGEDMDALAGASGAEFDDMWLSMMIEHHTGAIEMAVAVQEDGANADVKALAQQIVTAQRAEIDEMTALLDA